MESKIRNNNGKIFCFCLSMSVKNRIAVTIKPLKIRIDTASMAQPGARNISIIVNNKPVNVINLTN